MVRAIDKYSGGVFNPDDVRILVIAFDDAWRSLLASGITFESDRESKAVRDTLAKYIIEQARYGERDRRRLRDGALLQYAQSELKNKPRKWGTGAFAEEASGGACDILVKSARRMNTSSILPMKRARSGATIGGVAQPCGCMIPDQWMQVHPQRGFCLRVCPETSVRITKFSEHEPD